ncbi:MAG: histidine phosphatase family protein [Candidatus Nanopelagicales bacterium]
MSLVRVHLVRHGQSEWNVIGRLQGQTAHPQLTELGREQAAQAASTLAAMGLGTAALWSSDLVRALQTAAIIGERLGLAVAEDLALREQALGRFEGAHTSALHAEQTPTGLHVGDVRWGGGESTADVHARLGTFFRRELQHAPREMIVVSHGDTIRVARAWLQDRSHRDLDWDDIGNGAVISVEVRQR